MDYWKRKKAMESMVNKKQIVAQELRHRKQQAKTNEQQKLQKEIQEKRKLEMDRKRMEMAKYDAVQHKQKR